MQITSTLSQQKMEPTNGNLTVASSPVEPLSSGAADQVAGAFCRAFYTQASEHRDTISKFYGHESIFNFEEEQVTGSSEICKHYNNLPESSHFKIHSIKGIPTLHRQGVMVQVLGSLNFRPFTQSFILGQQGQKKYYVEVDHLQFVDNFFEVVSAQAKSAAPAAATAGNGNGVTVSKPVKPQAEEPKQPVKQTPKPTPKKEEAPRPPKQETPKVVKEEKKPVAQPQKAQAPAPVAAPAPMPEPVPQEPPKPRTWAHLVGGGAKQQPPQQQSFGPGPALQQQQMHHQMQQQMFQQPQRPQQSASNEHHGEENANERKIYLGGITREIVPSNTAQAETEIKQVFYKYGEVEEVRMPRKVLDSPNDTSKHAFAFITMRTKQGVQAIFAEASRDDQGNWKLPLKLDAFGFDGLAQISEQRDPPSGGFRGGRGGFQGRGGGQFFRGRGGAAPRGGPRGFQNGGQH